MRRFSIAKIFLNLSLGTALIFLIFGGLALQMPIQYLKLSNGVKNEAVSLSMDYVMRFFEMEIPFFEMSVQADLDSTEKQSDGAVTTWLNLLTLYSLKNPNDWIRQEIPVFSIVKIDGTTAIEPPMESVPTEEFFLAENTKAVNDIETNKQESEIVQATTGTKKVVFIYHTHNRESFLPEIAAKKPNEAYHPTINITLVGKKLSEELNYLGIGSEVSSKDYWTELENYSLSYKHSLETVKAVIQQNKDIQYIFDIHRDANIKEKTTRTINGKNFAAVYFIIGEGNKNYQKNMEFALKIHQRLEKLYPGLSKGIYEKKKTNGTDGEYNQSISPYSLTIEIGGVENTLEEEYRTAKALAEAIADVYWEAEKVDVKPQY